MVLIPDSIPAFLAFGLTIPATLIAVSILGTRRRKRMAVGFWAGTPESVRVKMSLFWAKLARRLRSLSKALPLVSFVLVPVNVFVLQLENTLLVSVGDVLLVVGLSAYLYYFSAFWQEISK